MYNEPCRGRRPLRPVTCRVVPHYSIEYSPKRTGRRGLRPLRTTNDNNREGGPHETRNQTLYHGLPHPGCLAGHVPRLEPERGELWYLRGSGRSNFPGKRERRHRQPGRVGHPSAESAGGHPAGRGAFRGGISASDVFRQPHRGALCAGHFLRGKAGGRHDHDLLPPAGSALQLRGDDRRRLRGGHALHGLCAAGGPQSPQYVDFDHAAL